MKDLHNKFLALVAGMQTKQSREAVASLSKATPQELAEAYRRGITPRTSVSSPLRIDAIEISATGGAIGMTICPGKKGPSDYGGPWQRDLASDVGVLRSWGCRALLTVMEPGELESYRVANLGEIVAAEGIAWYHIPMTDGDPPDVRFDALWPTIGQRLVEELEAGNRIVVHCLGGLGRTGTIVCLLLVELGYTSHTALEIVRNARPGTIETAAQESFVLSYVPRLKA
jgi:protein-tyrosine phosphatase